LHHIIKNSNTNAMKTREILFVLLTLVGVGCSPDRQTEIQQNATPFNGIYYWKTTFALNETEKAFLEEHQVKRLYLRLFDVVPDNEVVRVDGFVCDVVPNATITFKQEVPEGLEVVPVVYITIDALRKMAGREGQFAQLITERVANMADFNELGTIKEVQLDCDWTQRTQENYFLLCKETSEQLRELDIQLSCTIRLWQLNLPAPPVDRGVLMLYNTGSVGRLETNNSILDINDVKPYLNSKTYSLPLDYALPTYDWYVWLRNGQYHGLLHQFNDSLKLQPGDTLRHERATFEQIMEVKQTVMDQLQTQSANIIIYHLDSANLSNYSNHEIDQIYSRD